MYINPSETILVVSPAALPVIPNAVSNEPDKLSTSLIVITLFWKLNVPPIDTTALSISRIVDVPVKVNVFVVPANLISSSLVPPTPSCDNAELIVANTVTVELNAFDPNVLLG